MEYDAAVEVYKAMVKVRQGCDVVSVLDGMFGSAPARISLRGIDRGMLRVRVMEMWESGCSIDEIVSKTGAKRSMVYRLLKKMRSA